MEPQERTITLRTPCCTREVRPAFLAEAAVLVYRRTCPSCRQRWQIVVKPMRKVGRTMVGGTERIMHVHTATWAERP